MIPSGRARGACTARTPFPSPFRMDTPAYTAALHHRPSRAAFLALETAYTAVRQRGPDGAALLLEAAYTAASRHRPSHATVHTLETAYTTDNRGHHCKPPIRRVTLGPACAGVLHGAAPRVWKNGSGHPQDFWVGTTRFTPACAGKCPTEYPAGRPARAGYCFGKSPRMWGNSFRSSPEFQGSYCSAHPRVCGEMPGAAARRNRTDGGEHRSLANEHSKLRRWQRKDTAAGWPNLPSLARKAFFLPDHARRTVTFMMDNILWPARRTVHIKTI